VADELRISDDLAFPLDAVTETFLYFAKRGVGKTYAGSVMAEAMIKAGLPVCIIDPLGVWWGLRSSADGTGPGLPVTILGGDHADLPLTAESGALVGQLVIAERIPVILDLSAMSKTQQRRFVMDLFEWLFDHNRDPLHLFVDEADMFAPQHTRGEIARLVGAYNDVVRRGRVKGLGCTSITQRPAVLNADIRSQCEVLLAMRLTGKLDIAAIDDWISAHADPDQARELKASLPKLPVGTAWVWSPGWLEILVRIKVRQRDTFDSSATPKVGERRIVPREFARVDPADLARMAGLLAQDDAETPAPPSPAAADAALRREIARLTAELEAERAKPAREVEVPVLTPGDLAAVEQIITPLRDALAGVELALSRAARPAAIQPAPALAAVATSPVPRRAAPQPPDGAPALKAGARRMLAVLARQYPLTATRAQLAALAGMKRTGGTFGSYFSALRTGGMISEAAGVVSITDAGLATAGVDPGAAPLTAGEIRDMWRGVLKAGARTMLDALLAAYPARMTRDQLADAAGLERSGGTFGSYLSSLRSNGLADVTSDGIRAADVFFLGVQTVPLGG
jgi:hypothetical protein